MASFASDIIARLPNGAYMNGSLENGHNENDSRSSKMAPDALSKRYDAVRAATLRLTNSLSVEDQCAQSMPDASPTKWHLAHTTWFFETFLLESELRDYKKFNPAFANLFNSYYETVGPRPPRPQRGLLTRPALKEVLSYRTHVDQAMKQLMRGPLSEEVKYLIDLGLAHEEQHQELILSDILHLFAQSPLYPAYASHEERKTMKVKRGEYVSFEGGLVEIGHDGNGFAFDNERPRHKIWLDPFELSDSLVSNREWLDFIADGGYRNPLLWLSDGWTRAQSEAWTAPIYWVATDDGWMVMGLNGLRPLDPDASVTHISYFEACAFAAWAGARLPTEGEWEFAVTTRAKSFRGLFDQVWQWTSSAYSPYPGFKPGAGAIGEYNGKFMSGQMVLRGGAATTPIGHSRVTYRNFYRPHQRWMLSGVRLARNIIDEEDREFAEDIRTWLAAPQVATHPKYLYDAKGSHLFEEICRTPEYYLTRTETALLRSIAADLSSAIPAGAVLVEFGSGASEKTRLILDTAPQLSTYVPIDISPTALDEAAKAITANYPHLQVVPLVGDFHSPLKLPSMLRDAARVGFFPGSTIGNFTAEQIRTFFLTARNLLGDDAKFIIGIDIVKDESTLLAAYNDAAGVTRDFNKNLLAHINRQLGGDFNLSAFDHKGIWNKEESRMEMHLISRCDQVVHVAGKEYRLAKGQSLHTENCMKFTPAQFEAMVTHAGWTMEHRWLNDAPEFAVYLLKTLERNSGQHPMNICSGKR